MPQYSKQRLERRHVHVEGRAEGHPVIDAVTAAKVAAGIIATLTGRGGRTGPGGAVRQACEIVAGQRNPRMASVLAELEAMGEDPHALEALAGLRGFRSMGEFFDPKRVPARMNADFTVWRADLQLPSAEEMTNEHLYEAMTDDKIESLARFYAITAASRAALLSDLRFSMLAVADAHALMTPQGEELFISTNLEGRKRNAVLLLDFQSAGMVKRHVTEHMPIRFAGRTNTQAAAMDSLAFLGMERVEWMAERLAKRPEDRMGWPSGRFLHRDSQGRTGIVQVVTPAVPELIEAFSTTPKGA